MQENMTEKLNFILRALPMKKGIHPDKIGEAYTKRRGILFYQWDHLRARRTRLLRHNIHGS